MHQALDYVPSTVLDSVLLARRSFLCVLLCCVGWETETFVLAKEQEQHNAIEHDTIRAVLMAYLAENK